MLVNIEVGLAVLCDRKARIFCYLTNFNKNQNLKSCDARCVTAFWVLLRLSTYNLKYLHTPLLAIMTIPASSRSALLSALLLELIEILRDRKGDTWAAIIRIAADKSATIAVDDARIYVQVEGGQEMQITISEAKSDAKSDVETDAVNDFESTGRALRNIMFGKSTLEKSVASGKIFIRASFGDLLKIRSIVASVLADTEIDPRLLSLWTRFDQEWENLV